MEEFLWAKVLDKSSSSSIVRSFWLSGSKKMEKRQVRDHRMERLLRDHRNTEDKASRLHVAEVLRLYAEEKYGFSPP